MKKIILCSIAILLFACQSIYDGTYEDDDPEPTTPPEQYSHLGLVAYFPFDGDLKDYCDTSNYCIDLSDSVFVNGVSGQAKDFNGETDMLRLYKTLHAGYGLSFSFWVKPRGILDSENNGIIIGKYNSSTVGRCFLVYTQSGSQKNAPSLRTSFYPYGNYSNISESIYSNVFTTDDIPAGRDSSNYTIFEPRYLPLNEWSHCVINVSDSTLEAWINGVLSVSTRRYQEYYNDVSSRNNDVQTYIGNVPNAGSGSNNHFNGSLDELRVYNCPLTADEIQTLYVYPGGLNEEE